MIPEYLFHGPDGLLANHIIFDLQDDSSSFGRLARTVLEPTRFRFVLTPSDSDTRSPVIVDTGVEDTPYTLGDFGSANTFQWDKAKGRLLIDLVGSDSETVPPGTYEAYLIVWGSGSFSEGVRFPANKGETTFPVKVV